ncbi:MAG TPA: adenylate/guanylate cyclase domain-containing protein, partial [Allocoleopsis sp.]
ENGIPSNISRLIYQLNTSIILQKVNNIATENALKGITGIKIVKNYYNQTVISAYTPIKINGLNWIMLTEIELEEAYNPIDKIQKYILICLVISLVIITFINRYIADYFVKPINQILDNARQISEGNDQESIVLNSRDELKEIAQFFNTAIEAKREQEELLQQKNQSNENLLLNILPASVVEQIKQGSTQIAEQFQQITMMVMTFGRFEQLVHNKNIIEITNLINKLIDMIDEITMKYDVEKLKTYADQYVAVCGLSKTYLNHTKRIVDCALEIAEIIHKFNEDYGTKINFCIGIQTGVMFGSIIGKKKFTYELWGENVTIANHLSRYGEIDAICVTQSVYDNLHEMYNFHQGKEINIQHLGNIQTWVLRKQWLQKLILDLTDGLDFDDIN